MAYDDDRSRLGLRCVEARRLSDAAFNVQKRYIQRWQAIAEIFCPARADFTQSLTDNGAEYDALYTIQPQLALRSLSQSIGAMTRPKGVDWFKLTVEDEDLAEVDVVQRWCHDATQTMKRAVYRAGANFAAAMAESDRDYALIGNSVLRRSYNADESSLLFSCAHPRDCAWVENSEYQVDELHEKMRRPLRYFAHLFGAAALPSEWRKRLDTNPLDEVTVCRSVVPINRDSYDRTERPRTTARYASLYHAMDVKESEAAIREGFFDSFPYVVRRWARNGQSPYGESMAAQHALADGRSLNTAAMSVLKSIEWQVDPPMTAVDEAIVGEVRLEAGGVTLIDQEFARSAKGKALDRIEVGDPRDGLNYLAMTEARIDKSFYQHLLRMPEREMTAQEFMRRLRMVLRDAAPVFEPIESEYSRLMEGVLELMLRVSSQDGWGAFQPGPPEIGASRTEFEFLSALNAEQDELQRAEALEVQTQHERLLAAGSSAADYIDMDEVTRASLKGFNPKWIKKTEDVEALRQQRAQQQADRQKAEEAAMVADMALKAKPDTMRMLKQEAADAGIPTGQVRR